MYLYSKFCDETLDECGVLQDFSLHYPDNYNFGYDVVDEMACRARSSGLWFGVIRQENIGSSRLAI